MGEYLVAPIGRQLGYLMYCNSNVENLRNQVEKLKGGLQGLIDEAKRNGEDIRADVQNWLDEITAEVERLNDNVAVNKRCYPNWSCHRYRIRGVGKTTLVKQVGKGAKEDKLFGQVVMAVVTQIPNIKNIQEQIADMLGLKFSETTDSGRAAGLRGTCVNTPNLNVVAREVAGKCGGLPIALVTVGRALGDKDIEEWKKAAQKLKESKPTNEQDADLITRCSHA
ncbi:hypothetical protein HHK36_027279 [Tetracentron sinense]|uniref:Disease resistance protein n=1 Tax=Tetracentron sinense TaxID=13715 RepID=A0A834YH49_TETSI|nr:hypothetical protein HHK36_027279 [Tetracentron sinense]